MVRMTEWKKHVAEAIVIILNQKAWSMLGARGRRHLLGLASTSQG